MGSSREGATGAREEEIVTEEEQMEAKLISIAEGATRLGISRFTLRAWIRQRIIPHVRLGRRVLLAPIDIEKFIAANRVEARAAAMAAAPRTILNTPSPNIGHPTPARRKESAGDGKSSMR
jgi:excisionase family DNA binding protein